MTCTSIVNIAQHARFFLMLCVVVGFLVQSRAAGAAPAPAQVEGRIVELIVDGNRGTFDLPSHMDRVAAIDFPWMVERVTGKIGPWIKTRLSGRRLFVALKKPVDRVLTMHVQAGELQVTFAVLPAAKPEEAYALAVVVPRTEVERRKQEVARAMVTERDRIQEEANQLVQGILRKQFPGVAHKISKYFAHGLVEQTRVMRTAAEPREVQAGDSAAACTPQVDVGASQVEEGVTLMAFGIINRCASAYPIGHVRVVDRHKNVNYGGAPIIWAATRSDKPDVLAEIGPGEEATGLVMVESAAAASGLLMLTVTDPHGLQPLVAAPKQFGFVPIEPKTEAEREEERLEKAAKGRVSLHVQAIMGGIWLVNPQDKDALDPTSLKGLGARVTYGFNRYLGLEADVVGASSGESRFEDVIFNGQQGHLLRSAKLGRVSFGGVIRMGMRRYIPVVRVGLGLQGASHTAEMEIGGVRMPGPDVGFQFDATLYFGGGLDIRLGDQFLAGFSATFDRSMDGGSRSLVAGAHLGYSWKP